MTHSISRPATPEGLFLWVMHRFSDTFAEHAIIKGGMAMRLLDCPRSTTHIDYIFVPFDSKKVIRKQIEAVLSELQEAEIQVEMHSKMLRAEIRLDDAAIQLEANVALECEATPISTGAFAMQQGQPAQVVRIMSPNLALAHKLAAWNERRLIRDLYDCCFFISRLGEMPEMDALAARLAKVQSRIPALKSCTSMTLVEFATALKDVVAELTQSEVEAELGGLVPQEELAGLALRMKSTLITLTDNLHPAKSSGD